MELRFRNVTKCTPNLYDEFLEFHNKKYKLRDISTLLLIFVVVAYMVIFNIVYHNYIIAIFITVIGIVGYIFNNNYQKKVVRKERKSSKIRNQEEIDFRFYNYVFIVISKKGKKKIRYHKLYRVNGDNQNFYLYLDKTHALIVSKSGFIKGNAKDFKTFISKKCRFKYSD